MICELVQQHHSFLLSHSHDAHVLDWYGARPDAIRLLRSAGKGDAEIGATLALSVSSVRYIAKGWPSVYVLECWRKCREDARSKLQWHSELPASIAIILEDLGMQSKGDCHILASDTFETYHGSIRVQNQLIPLKTFNRLRAWIGVAAYTIPPRKPTDKEVANAKRILAMAANHARKSDEVVVMAGIEPATDCV